MTVEIKFEAGLDYQHEAIDAVCSLFIGWNRNLAVVPARMLQESDALITESMFANGWGIADEDLLANARFIQHRTRTNEVGERLPIIPEGYKLDPNFSGSLRDFSIEMETGTGKTYVYLRTAIELYLKYGLSKFVIVVPTVAIREGVIASLKLLKEHFREVYSGLPVNSFVYDSKNLAQLRQFATSKDLQILVMNIHAFNKTDVNVIHRDSDGAGRPIDFITGVNPVVIMDEPQKLSGEKQTEAIESLNPLFRLRYSATHKENHCMVYRLGPMDAYERRLVKRIEVLSMSAEEDLNIAYVELRKVNVGAGAPTATVVINGHDKRKHKTVRVNDSLSALTGMKVYDGWDVEQIAGPTEDRRGYIEFRNGRIVFETHNTEIDKDWWFRAQIEAAVTKHLETELLLKRAAANGEIHPIKPLTLFFIDQVANYDPEDGKFKLWFDEIYEGFVGRGKFRTLDLPPAAKARAAYFATSKGKAKDSKEGGDTADDAAAYDKIMRDKQTLLSPDEPIRFIFSHSALAEGWDNPNVFTICNMQDGKSETRRRQQIGRGLRLPVMTNGERNRNHRFNLLTVIASETFAAYAAGLQNEIEKETGESFGGRIGDARKRAKVTLKQDYRSIPGFGELWASIAPKTRYNLKFSSEDLVDEATKRLKDIGNSEPIRVPKIVFSKAELVFATGENIGVGSESEMKAIEYARKMPMPDILTELQALLPISRASIAKIIELSGRKDEARINPASFVNQVRRAVNQALAHTIVDYRGIEYKRLQGNDAEYSAELFDKQLEIDAYQDNLVAVNKSIYDYVVCDSDVERRFARDLDDRKDIELFIKLPHWFKIDTPIGGYNPDWAIVRRLESGEKKVYLVRETKGTTDVDALRFEGERWKIEFGRKHFLAIEVDYKITSNANQLDVDIPFKLRDEEVQQGD